MRHITCKVTETMPATARWRLASASPRSHRGSRPEQHDVQTDHHRRQPPRGGHSVITRDARGGSVCASRAPSVTPSVDCGVVGTTTAQPRSRGDTATVRLSSVPKGPATPAPPDPCQRHQFTGRPRRARISRSLENADGARVTRLSAPCESALRRARRQWTPPCQSHAAPGKPGAPQEKDRP